MTAATSTRVDEMLEVEQWRFVVLQKAGYPKPLAKVLAACLDVDLHDAVELLDRGCSPKTAGEILL